MYHRDIKIESMLTSCSVLTSCTDLLVLLQPTSVVVKLCDFGAGDAILDATLSVK